jgi:hypothetical protein
VNFIGEVSKMKRFERLKPGGIKQYAISEILVVGV